MKDKMKNLVITEYCSSDKRKFRFAKEFCEDPLICYYLSQHVKDGFEESENASELSLGGTYIVADKRKLVGIIKLAFMEEDGTLNLHYGVHPDYRRKHYGTEILKEAPKYIFEKLSDVNRIELYINENNKASIKCAENANFIYQREIELREDHNLKVYVLNR